MFEWHSKSVGDVVVGLVPGTELINLSGMFFLAVFAFFLAFPALALV